MPITRTLPEDAKLTPWVPSVLVERTKHATYYHDATSPEALASVALALLTARWEQGYWYPPVAELFTDEARRSYVAAPVMTAAELDALPEHLRAVERRRQEQAAEHDQQRTEYERWRSTAERVVRDQDARLVYVVAVKAGRDGLRRAHVTTTAWMLLQDRRDHQYEGVDLHELMSPLPTDTPGAVV